MEIDNVACLLPGDDSALRRLAAARGFGAYYPGLSALEVRSCRHLDDDDLLKYLAPQNGALHGCGHDLRELTISRCGRISPLSLQHVVDYAPNLRHLELRLVRVDQVPYSGPDTTDEEGQYEEKGQLNQSLVSPYPPPPRKHSSLSLLISSLSLCSLTLVGVETLMCAPSFHQLSSQPTLTELNLRDLRDFTNDQLLAFQHVQHLSVVNCASLSYISVSKDHGLSELRTLSFLCSGCVRRLQLLRGTPHSDKASRLLHS